MNRKVLVECPFCTFSWLESLDTVQSGSVKCKSCDGTIGVTIPERGIDLTVKPVVKTPREVGRPKSKAGRKSKTIWVSISDMQEYLLTQEMQADAKADIKQLIKEAIRDRIKARKWRTNVWFTKETPEFKLVVCRSQTGVLSFHVWRQPEANEDEPILSVGEFGVEAYHRVPPILYELAKALETRGGTVVVTDITKVADALRMALPDELFGRVA